MPVYRVLAAKKPAKIQLGWGPEKETKAQYIKRAKPIRAAYDKLIASLVKSQGWTLKNVKYGHLPSDVAQPTLYNKEQTAALHFTFMTPARAMDTLADYRSAWPQIEGIKLHPTKGFPTLFVSLPFGSEPRTLAEVAKFGPALVKFMAEIPSRFYQHSGD